MKPNLFQLRSPLTYNEPWRLSRLSDPKQVFVPKETVQDLGNHHVVGIEFLYQSYKNKLEGVILNENKHMNCELQVSVFLNAIHTCLLDRCSVFVICSDQNLHSWNYHLSKYGSFQVNFVTPSTKYDIPKSSPASARTALLLSASDIRLAQDFIDHGFTSVIVEEFDNLCNKLVFKRLYSGFNIGITSRNFYENPDPKTQWTMLNWANPGCVGKLNDFYETDEENFYCFRDNYRKWWLRLTWNFCETFKKPTTKEIADHNKIITDWNKDASKQEKIVAGKRKFEDAEELSERILQKFKKPDSAQELVSQNQIPNPVLSQPRRVTARKKIVYKSTTNRPMKNPVVESTSEENFRETINEDVQVKLEPLNQLEIQENSQKTAATQNTNEESENVITEKSASVLAIPRSPPRQRVSARKKITYKSTTNQPVKHILESSFEEKCRKVINEDVHVKIDESNGLGNEESTQKTTTTNEESKNIITEKSVSILAAPRSPPRQRVSARKKIIYKGALGQAKKDTATGLTALDNSKTTVDSRNESISDGSKFCEKEDIRSPREKRQEDIVDEFLSSMIEKSSVEEKPNNEFEPKIEQMQESESREISHMDVEISPERSEEIVDTIFKNTVSAKPDSRRIQDDKYVKLPTLDETPILSSIIKNFEISPEPVEQKPGCSWEKPHFSKSLSRPGSSFLSSLLENKDLFSSPSCSSGKSSTAMDDVDLLLQDHSVNESSDKFFSEFFEDSN